MLKKMLPFLITAGVALLTVAIASRVAPLKNIIMGSK